MAYLTGGGGQPLLILKEGTERKTKKNAFSNNVAAALAIAEAVRSTLGPKGLDKLLVDSLGDLTITNDGATILKEIDVQHPTAKMMVEVAKTQDDEVGDGTTSSVILCGAILEQVNELIQSGVHPSIVAKGVSKAKDEALKILEKIAYKVSEEEKNLMKNVVSTSMNSKMISLGKERLSELVLDAMLTLKKAGVKNLNKNVEKIKVVKKEGGDALHDTSLIKGIVIDKEIVHSQMPKSMKSPKIALLSFALEKSKGEWDAKISIESPDQMMAFVEEEESMVQKKVQKLIDMGVNVVLSQKAMDDIAIHYLKKAGIMAVKSVSKKDIQLISDAIGASVLNSIDDMSESDLGTCNVVKEKTIADGKFLFIEGCQDPRALTILIRGEGGKSLDETERGIHDALCVAATLLEVPAIVACGGAVEIELSKRITEYAKTFSGREQLVIEHFANALESIPATLAANAGLDAIDVLGEIRTAHKTENDTFLGYNLYTNKVEDMKAAGVIEPVSLVKTAIKTAAEVAIMIIRIDDMIRASDLGGGIGGGGPGGAGMPPM